MLKTGGVLEGLNKQMEEQRHETGKEVYTSTVEVLKQLNDAKTLSQFKELIKYAWSKIQTEAERYWRDKKIQDEKIRLNEDARLSITAYVITKARAPQIIPMLYALMDFINDTLYEECAPIATLESAIKVVQFEFEDKIVNNQSFASQS